MIKILLISITIITTTLPFTLLVADSFSYPPVNWSQDKIKEFFTLGNGGNYKVRIFTDGTRNGGKLQLPWTENISGKLTCKFYEDYRKHLIRTHTNEENIANQWWGFEGVDGNAMVKGSEYTGPHVGTMAFYVSHGRPNLLSSRWKTGSDFQPTYKEDKNTPYWIQTDSDFHGSYVIQDNIINWALSANRDNGWDITMSAYNVRKELNYPYTREDEEYAGHPKVTVTMHNVYGAEKAVIKELPPVGDYTVIGWPWSLNNGRIRGLFTLQSNLKTLGTSASTNRPSEYIGYYNCDLDVVKQNFIHIPIPNEEEGHMTGEGWGGMDKRIFNPLNFGNEINTPSSNSPSNSKSGGGSISPLLLLLLLFSRKLKGIKRSLTSTLKSDPR